MKKIISIILALTMILSVAVCVHAEDVQVKVKYNDKLMEFDVNPILENGRTLVPFRAIFEALGCTVSYLEEGDSAIVVARKADDILLVPVNEKEMLYSGELIELDVAAKIVDDRTLIPLRAVSEVFGAKVDWDEESFTALIYADQGDLKVSSVTVNDKILASDGTELINLAATYPVIDNPENDEFITTINDLNMEFAAGFLYGDEELGEKVNKIYAEVGSDAVPMELSSTYTIDTNKNGLISITHHTCTELYEDFTYNKESIVWDVNNKKQLDLTDILVGNLEDEINQTVYDAFIAYYVEELNEEFTAELAKKLGAELSNVRFYITDNSLVLYFNPGQVLEEADEVQMVEIPYSEGNFKIKLEAKGETIKPLPASVDINDLKDCTVAVSLEKGNAYVDDSGKMQMKVKVYAYDLYDMVDIANLKVGDTIIRSGEETKITEISRNDKGLVYVNGGQEKGGFDLYSNDSTVYYECGFNDVKSYYEIGEAVIPVSTEFTYTDSSDLDADPVKYYPGDFLTDDAGIKYEFTPHNTSLVIKDGYVVEMNKHYIP